MVEYISEKNFINDAYFEREFYPKYVTDIKSFKEYKKLENIIKNNNLQILFSYVKDETKFYIQYEVGFKVCDEKGEMLSVSIKSKFWDSLGNLLSFFPVLNYNKLTKRIVVSEIDKKELAEDCQLFIEYLDYIY